MTDEQFDICKDFHLMLIRAKVKPSTISNTKRFMVDGVACDKKPDQRAVEGLEVGIRKRFDSLKLWHSNSVTSPISKLIDIYNENNSRNPSDNVFHATFGLMMGSTMLDMSKQYGVNYQCMKALRIRIERWNEYSEKLNDTL